MNILVVGAYSFLAKALARTLNARAGCTLTGIVTTPRYQDIDSLYERILSAEEISTIGDVFDVVFLLAAYIPRKGSASEPLRLQASNVELPKKVVHHFPSARLVYASSVSVYAPSPEIITESSSVSPHTDYGVSKMKGEQEVMVHPNAALIRYTSLYGPNMHPDTFIPQIVNQALHQGQITLWGTGARLQNYLHVVDAVQMLIGASEKSGTAVYLGAAERSYSNFEIASIVSRLSRNVAIEHINEDMSPSFVYDPSWSHSELEFKAQVTIDEGLEELLNDG